MKLLKVLPAFVILMTLSIQSHAEELSFNTGRLSANNDLGSTYSWQIDYRQNFLRYMAWSAAWINEGHVPDHHRDGYSSELWGRLPLFNGKMSVAAGGGFDRLYDTQKDEATGNSLDVHSWAPIASISAIYYTESPWFFRFTVNWIMPHDNYQSRSGLIGVGYRLWKSPDEKKETSPETNASEAPRLKGNELTLSLGKSIVNTFNSESGVASGLEYRKEFARYADWTVSFINEGDADVIKRGGFASQIWLTDSFIDNHFRVGFGAGPYVFVDRDESDSNRSDVTGVVGPTISWRFNKNVVTRLTWNRVITDYNRDTDVFLLGVGYRWGEH